LNKCFGELLMIVNSIRGLEAVYITAGAADSCQARNRDAT
jgi:hypothetical protein